MDVIDKSAEMSNETVSINKMTGTKRYKTATIGSQTANFLNDTVSFNQKSGHIKAKAILASC